MAPTWIGSLPVAGRDACVPLPFDGDRHLRERRHVRTGPGAGDAEVGIGGDVDAERGLDAGTGGIEDAFVDHLPCPVKAFLAGLEHEHDVAGQRIAVAVEEFEGTDEPGRVQVVTASVHPP
jgi:hypothetical protein